LFSLPQLLDHVAHLGARLLGETADVHHRQQNLVVVYLSPPERNQLSD
jgi:hypothetical protein